ncbi:Flagellar biosynthesis protein FliC [plant metagenome]|uniref:Flagellin n=2 Tax=root TaxID=1 RepID=A0A1C3JZI1_9BURK|nr:FliC/FljB family flagellin [Orrella dioscoreae]SBT24565.1 Flagellar biosynthesis protein FliC [Orrella dioscoreae]SOE49495.1 Flagellar biosynthesis protein FliC [Orrella dioscoreae]
MAAVINTNYLALVAQNNLNKSQSSLGTAIERLSSGYRINSAKDDAAGLAIANRFTSNVRGLTQAARNANDGISLAQTTEGATGEITTHLQRIRELSLQAANGTYSSKDLASMQAEVEQRLEDIDRISQQTDFNGVKVLSEDTSLTLQVGARDGETITLNLKEISVSTLSLDTFSIAGPSGTTTAYGSGASVSGRNSAGERVEVGSGTTSLTFSNATAGGGTFSAANLVQDTRGNWYVSNGATGDAARYYAADIRVTDATQDANITGAAGLPTATVTFDSSKELRVASTNPLAAVDTALNTVDTLRSDLGAIQNRLESTVSNLNSIVNNLTASRSRIEDADYAVEVSNMTKNQILQQAGTSVLAQANQVPQTVLSLLG